MFNLEKSVQRMQWRFRKENNEFVSFKPNKQDVEALNCFFNWINQQKKESLTDNSLFAKLLVYVYTLKIRENQTHALDDIPQKEVSKILDSPLSVIFQSFKSDLHLNQISRIVNQFEGDVRKVKENDLKQLYSDEYVAKKLSHMITEALNRFK